MAQTVGVIVTEVLKQSMTQVDEHMKFCTYLLTCDSDVKIMLEEKFASHMVKILDDDGACLSLEFLAPYIRDYFEKRGLELKRFQATMTAATRAGSRQGPGHRTRSGAGGKGKGRYINEIVEAPGADGVDRPTEGFNEILSLDECQDIHDVLIEKFAHQDQLSRDGRDFRVLDKSQWRPKLNSTGRGHENQIMHHPDFDRSQIGVGYSEPIKCFHCHGEKHVTYQRLHTQEHVDLYNRLTTSLRKQDARSWPEAKLNSVFVMCRAHPLCGLSLIHI